MGPLANGIAKAMPLAHTIVAMTRSPGALFGVNGDFTRILTDHAEGPAILTLFLVIRPVANMNGTNGRLDQIAPVVIRGVIDLTTIVVNCTSILFVEYFGRIPTRGVRIEAVQLEPYRVARGAVQRIDRGANLRPGVGIVVSAETLPLCREVERVAVLVKRVGDRIPRLVFRFGDTIQLDVDLVVFAERSSNDGMDFNKVVVV